MLKEPSDVKILGVEWIKNYINSIWFFSWLFVANGIYIFLILYFFSLFSKASKPPSKFNKLFLYSKFSIVKELLDVIPSSLLNLIIKSASAFITKFALCVANIICLFFSVPLLN